MTAREASGSKIKKFITGAIFGGANLLGGGGRGGTTADQAALEYNQEIARRGEREHEITMHDRNAKEAEKAWQRGEKSKNYDLSRKVTDRDTAQASRLTDMEALGKFGINQLEVNPDNSFKLSGSRDKISASSRIQPAKSTVVRGRQTSAGTAPAKPAAPKGTGRK